MSTANRTHERHRRAARRSQRRTEQSSTPTPIQSALEAADYSLPAGGMTRRAAGRNPGRYARYIGRVGALAVALGLGAAAATTPGIAFAEEPGTTSSADPPDTTPPPAHGSATDARHASDCVTADLVAEHAVIARITHYRAHPHGHRPGDRRIQHHGDLRWYDSYHRTETPGSRLCPGCGFGCTGCGVEHSKCAPGSRSE